MKSPPLRALALLALLSSCQEKAPPLGGLAPSASEVASPLPSLPADERPDAAVNLVTRLSRCELDHEGALVDFGSPAIQGVLGWWSLVPDPSLVDAERDGETWTKVSNRNLLVRFVMDEPAPIFVALRVRGVVSRSAAILLDGKPLGTLPLLRGQVRVVSTHPTVSPIAAGTHAVEIRFGGSTRGQTDPLAEIDWVRAGVSEEESTTFAAPTLRQIVSDVPLSGVPHQSVALRAPSTLRCSTFVSAGARLKVALGFEGQGEGQGVVAVARDGEAPVELRAVRVKGGERAEWSPVDVPLDSFAGKLVTLEFKSKSASPGGRMLFGDPTLYLPASHMTKPPAAKLVVVVMMSGLDHTRLANHDLFPAIRDLERASTRFEAHRVPTTLSAGVIATLLTGMPPRAHGVEDSGARLSGSLTTLGVAARDGSVQTAMFTGCPPTFEAFGFSRGWDEYAMFSPIGGDPAVAPLTQAASWTAEHMKNKDARALVIVHARGGHPPWDVTINDAAKLSPPDYSGPIDPRRAAEVIARARGKHTRFRLSEGDRTRMWALYDAALVGQDSALGELVDTLKKAELWDDTLFIVSGDVSISAESRAPFGDSEELTEEALRVPLWVHFPGGALAGSKVTLPTAVSDLSRSILDALGLPTPEGFEGVDLFATASGAALPDGRALWATLGPRYASRLGDFTLSGVSGKTPTLCDLVSDPNCEIDRFEKMPRAATLLFRATYDAELDAQKQRKPREPATIDANTAAALQVWGE